MWSVLNMAAVDKTFGTIEQWYALYGFIEKLKKELKQLGIKFKFYPIKENDKLKEVTIFNTGYKEDLWLIINCPFVFVINRLLEVYECKTKYKLVKEIAGCMEDVK